MLTSCLDVIHSMWPFKSLASTIMVMLFVRILALQTRLPALVEPFRVFLLVTCGSLKFIFVLQR